jgi:hypothetical protein
MTFLRSADMLLMARATYEELQRLPPILGQPRSSAPWETLLRHLQSFASATTKAGKREWFEAQGFTDTSFLYGISLPKGPGAEPKPFTGRDFPVLPTIKSSQHDADADTKAFFDALVTRWLGNESLDGIGKEFAVGAVRIDKSKLRANRNQVELVQLVARLKLWKVIDHGAVSHLAHSDVPLTKAQIAFVNDLVEKSSAIMVNSGAEALVPLITRGVHASPLLPYIIRSLRPEKGVSQAVAILRLRHAPYDTIGLLAEKTESGWKLVNVLSIVDQ